MGVTRNLNGVLVGDLHLQLSHEVPGVSAPVRRYNASTTSHYWFWSSPRCVYAHRVAGILLFNIDSKLLIVPIHEISPITVRCFSSQRCMHILSNLWLQRVYSHRIYSLNYVTLALSPHIPDICTHNWFPHCFVALMHNINVTRLGFWRIAVPFKSDQQWSVTLDLESNYRSGSTA